MNLFLIFIVSVSRRLAVLASVENEIAQVVSVHKNPVLFKCHIPKELDRSDVTVTWIGPQGDLVVTNDVTVPQYKTALTIVGNREAGESQLFFKFAKFPEHVGIWTCLVGSPVLAISRTNLTLLVPPPIMNPSIWPKEMSMNNFENGVTTVTCTGHYAQPPLMLDWKKKSGPDADYEVCPPSYIASRNGLVSISIKLILTLQNVGSVFECSSKHVVCNETFSNLFSFVHHKALINPNMASMSIDATSLSSSEKALVYIFIIFISLTFIVFILSNKFRSKWTWKGSKGISSQKQIFLNSTNSSGAMNDVSLSVGKKSRDWHMFRSRLACSCLLLPLLFLILTVPIYFKGLELPFYPSVDQVMAVFAGSALWLDCRSLFQVTNLIRVVWLFNGNIFYHQYLSNSLNIGYPHNSTIGFQKGFRVTSTSPGQIALWPVLPGEDGAYTCEVLVSEEGDKRISYRKTTMVHVLTKPVANPILLGLILLSILFTFVVLFLILCNCIKIFPNSKKENPDMNKC